MNIHRNCLLAVLLLAVSVAAQQSKSNKPPQAQPTPRPTPKPTPTTTPAPKDETFTKRLLRILGLTTVPGSLKGDEDDLRGDVWLAKLNNNTTRRLTYEGEYRSPLLTPDAQAVWALKGEAICEIPVEGGAVKELLTVAGIIKLAGVDGAANKRLVLLHQDNERRVIVELLALTDGQRTALPYEAKSGEDARMLAYLRGWERSYDGGKLKLFTQRDPQREGRNVYLEETGRAAVNVSHCDDGDCGQAALAVKARSVVFIKSK